MPNVFAQFKVSRDVRSGLREVTLGSGEDSETPEGLVVVSFLALMGRGHVVELRAGLGENSSCNFLVISMVASVMGVVEHATHHGTTLPPVIGRIEIDKLGVRALVEGHGILGNGLGDTLNRSWECVSVRDSVKCNLFRYVDLLALLISSSLGMPADIRETTAAAGRTDLTNLIVTVWCMLLI